MSKPLKMCSWPHCEEREDPDRGCRLCAEHAQRWVQSKAFIDTAQHPDVRAAMFFGESFFKKEVAKHRRRWVKAEAAREESDAAQGKGDWS